MQSLMRAQHGEVDEECGEEEVEHYEQLLCDEIERLMEKVEEKAREALQAFCEAVNEGAHPRDAYRRALRKLPRV